MGGRRKRLLLPCRTCPPCRSRERPPIAPKRVAIYWDASGSRASADHRREIDLVKALLAAWTAPAAGGPGTVEVDLVLVRNVQSPPRQFTITEKDVSQLTAALESVDYDGGTQLGAIAPIDGARMPDLALLFSDGISTFGRDEPQPLDVPLYAFSSDVEGRLRSAPASGAQQPRPVLQSAAAGRRGGRGGRETAARCSLLSATVKGGRASELLPAAPQPIDGHFMLVGRLDGPQA